MLTLRCANLCGLQCVARAGDFPLRRAALPFSEKRMAENQGW